MNPDALRFAAPEALYLLLLVPVLALLILFGTFRRRRLLARFASPPLLRRFQDDRPGPWPLFKSLLLLAAAACAVLALARPQFGSTLETVKRKGMEMVLAIDVSNSMRAEDVKPDRLSRAKQEMARFADRLGGDRIALVAFAGEAFLQCPLTSDYSAFRIFLDVLDPGLIAAPGTALDQAIRISLQAFGEEKRGDRAIILLTDGEDQTGGALEAAREAKRRGVRIFTVGIGSAAGVPIPLRQDDGSRRYLTDAEGQVVMTRLDEALLRSVAAEAAGKYFHAGPGRFELLRILEEVRDLERVESEEKLVMRHEERFQIPLGLAALLLLLETLIPGKRRRNRSAGVSLAAAPALPPLLPLFLPFLLIPGLVAAEPAPEKTASPPKQALGLKPGSRSALSAQKAYREGRFAEAAKEYGQALEKGLSPAPLSYNLGNAEYRAGRFEEAASRYRQALTAAESPGSEAMPPRSSPPEGTGSLRPEAASLSAPLHFNLGNALYRQKQFAAAAQHFKSALRLDPRNAEARRNLELAFRQLKKDPEKPPPENPGNGNPPPQHPPGQEGSSSESPEKKPESESSDPKEGKGPESPDPEPPSPGAGQKGEGKDGQEQDAGPESEPRQETPQGGNGKTPGQADGNPEDTDGNGAPAPATRAGEMSREEAERLLNAMQGDEKTEQRRLHRRKPVKGAAGNGKDW